MRDERQAVVEAILQAGHIPAGMELFAAGDESQLETIRRWIGDSDVFMLILGGRYGSIDPKSGKSYIQLEYEYAAEKKKPLFAAVISDAYLDAKVREKGKGAIETTNGQMLDSFREIVTNRICRFFEDVKDLKSIVHQSLAEFEKKENLSGWIHGGEVVDRTALSEENNRLREEVTRLQATNAELRRQNDILINPRNIDGGTWN